jgi:hypothetical protein
VFSIFGDHPKRDILWIDLFGFAGYFALFWAPVNYRVVYASREELIAAEYPES